MKFLRSRAAVAAALALAALLSACTGDNPWNGGTGPGPGQTTQDKAAPTVDVLLPDAQTPAVNAGDSLFVRARVRDDRSVVKVTFEAYAVRGRPELGTDTAVARFVSKDVDFGKTAGAVTDTTIDRFLLATSDTARENGVFVVVTATDSAGNKSADTTRINITRQVVAPTVDILSPTAASATVNLGDSLLVTARVGDDRRLARVTFSAFSVRGDPALGTAVVVPRYLATEVSMPGTGPAVRDTTLSRYLRATPDTARETGVYVVVTAADSSGYTTADTVRISIGGQGAAPLVTVLAPAENGTVNLGEPLLVRARVRDERRLARVSFQAFSLRGNAAQGTATVVPRYESREADLLEGGRVVTDTTVERLLPATPDTARESGVLVVVTAVDTSGYASTDTVRFTIAGNGAAPLVDVLSPAPGATVLLHDSLVVRARVRDDRRLARVTFSAFSIRGNAAQGTATVVPRYVSREADLSATGRAVTDTTVERVLVATSDTARESGVYVVVTAVDSTGYSRSDTVRINIAGPSAAPSVEIVLPDSRTGTIAVGDSVFVRARVRDDRRLARVVFEGFSVRGSVALGTDTTVERYASKTVELAGGSRVVTDTVLDRFLVATADTARESGVFIVVTAVDSMGLSTSDTTLVSIGGPRVQVSIPAGQDPRGGAELRIRVLAEDSRDLITSVRVRGSGAFAFDTTFSLPTPRPTVDTLLVIDIPLLAADGTLQIDASTVSGALQPGTAVPVQVQVRAAEVDRIRPRTSFQTNVRPTVEQRDSFEVTVTGVDETRIDSVGVTVLAIRRSGGSPDTLRVYRGAGPVSTGTFRFQISDLGLSPLDTASVDLEVTAWSKDSSGNCGAAVTPNTPQQLDCVPGPGGVVLTTISGRLVPVFIARGATIRRPNGTDVVPDLVADANFVYLANYTRNRVDLLPLGGTAYTSSVNVGSQPWGVALGRTGDSLFVANSGGTNISVVGLDGSPFEDRRILTRNERLFGVDFSVQTGDVTQVAIHDYSDRPQFLAQASNGLLVYSTKPTAAARDGTVRIYQPRTGRSDVFTGYVDRHTSGKALVVNADSAFYSPPDEIIVCPRRRVGDTTDPPCIGGRLSAVSAALTAQRSEPPNASGDRYDTRLDIGANVADVGFADTTFVAASTDRRYVAVGEGARENARIPMFEASGDSLLLRGDVRDLIANSAERVIGLGLNRDGSLGVARGDEAYYFTPDLRRQGAVASGSPTGGVAMHPQSADYVNARSALSFVSGLDGAGRPYVDVIDAYHFRLVKRVYTRDPVVGALVVAPRAAGDPAEVSLRLYALTSGGVLGLTLTYADLGQPQP
ncbi:MAG TPA: hypothetical protein VGB24_19000 [Longimicrobium sp.]|jgi:hypothetical protein|uniref:YncE family protein n=1 Tax=Longimicrobium sp. TaxID=2029185 RepID=UPI002ED95417